MQKKNCFFFSFSDECTFEVLFKGAIMKLLLKKLLIKIVLVFSWPHTFELSEIPIK